MQQSIFGDEKKPDAVLKVVAREKVLSKNQQAFNRVTARIAGLRIEIDSLGARLAALSGTYNSEIMPVIQELGKEKIILAKTLAAGYKTIKLTEKQQDEVETIIFELLDDAFSVVEPDEAAEKLYNSLAEVPHKESLQEDEQEMKEELREQLYDMFGIDMNMDDFDESPEGYARFREKMQQKIEQRQDHGKRKKTKKQLQKEHDLKQQEEIKKRNIRSIYMSLAKLLHPDTEMDEIVKKEKEEIMKDVTKAYNENDLSALLKLELQWVAKENDHLEKLTDETLKIYISVLKEQVKELEMEKSIQMSNPAFQPVLRFLPMTETSAASSIKYEKEERAGYIAQMKNHARALEGSKLRSAIRDCIQYYYTGNKTNQEDFASFDEMMEMFMKTGPYKR